MIDPIIRLPHPVNVNDKRRSFGARAFQRDDDGYAFEAFVFECFRYARGERGFSKRLARGRDGAIDLLDNLTDPGSIAVAECKFIGSENAKEAPNRWAEVYRNLAKNLPRLYSDPESSPNSPYQAWLDLERPVSRYRFCVTAAMTPNQLSDLKKQIIADFGKLVSQGVEPLRRLAECEGAVEVLPWEWFDAELDEHPALAFRWFRGLPVGVDLPASQSGKEASFRNFLQSGTLRYFSRSQYVAETGAQLEGAETDFAATLAQGRKPGLIITGPGGVGKTRLLLELAAVLGGDDYGFDVYWLGRSSNFKSITDLAKRYPTDASVLLLIDYAEAVPALAEIADAVAHIISNTNHKFCLVATCRSSANSQVREGLNPLDAEERSLSSTRLGEADYVSWVTQSIISAGSFPEAECLARVCHGVPALAAFALFLFRNYRERFDLQFGALHSLGDFDKWFNHRIEILIGPRADRREQERALAHIALALPIPERRYPEFVQQWGALLDSLKTDRWIEYHDQAYVAVHDVFADSLAARWLFEAEHVATDHALELLDVAAKRLGLAQALTALERLAQHPHFNEIDGRRVVEVLLVNQRAQVEACCGLILKGKLLNFDDKLGVLSHSYALQQVVRRERSMDGILSYLAAEAAYMGMKSTDGPELQIISDLLDYACDQRQSSNMVLRRAYSFDPDRFRERALATCADSIGSEQAHFLIVQILKNGEPSSAIEPVVVRWLERHSRAYCATYLYRAWLDAGGGIQIVGSSLLEWLGEHGETDGAPFVLQSWLAAGGDAEAIAVALGVWVSAHGQACVAKFVYKAWLDAGGRTDVVATALLSWAGSHGQTESAGFVYTAWLDAGGSAGSVAASVLGWLDAHGQTESAGFVYTAWLNAGGDAESVAVPLLAWLDAHGQGEGAQFVYQAWLNAGGGIEAVAAPLPLWLRAHGQAISAQFIYKAWLDAGCEAQIVAAPLLEWINVHGQAESAQFVYSAWLDAGGDAEVVAASLLAWIDAHGQTDGAEFVYRSWLERQGPFEAILEPVTQWVKIWGRKPEFVYFSKILTRQSGLPPSVIFAIFEWCIAFPDNEDTMYRFSSLIGRLNDEKITFTDRSIFLNSIVSVVEGRGQLSLLDRQLICKTLKSLVLGPACIYNLDPVGSVRAVSEIVALATVFDRDLVDDGVDFLAESHGAMAMLVRQGLNMGMLCLKRDQTGLGRFDAWLHEHAPYRRRLPIKFLSNAR
ncbi:ATP-binding protein [Sphingomonas sp. CFBP 8765]|uniref:ATP-binding protein n=1 Tax=Sphingomonas sp. CFBP 8765 TaxID=2775274 RepID=UPI001784B1D8|nr:ATP-binding protein [Sphingomonas sp. CFBP 8765]MBD8469421.1 ATP-binding protein [Sphingomonas sp. CFBP 8765]